MNADSLNARIKELEQEYGVHSHMLLKDCKSDEQAEALKEYWRLEDQIAENGQDGGKY